MSANLRIKKGDTFKREFVFSSPDLDPVNLEVELKEIKFQARRSPGRNSVLSLTLSGGDITVEGNKITVEAPASVTQDINIDKGVYDLQFTYTDGVVYTPISLAPVVFEDDVAYD